MYSVSSKKKKKKKDRASIIYILKSLRAKEKLCGTCARAKRYFAPIDHLVQNHRLVNPYGVSNNTGSALC